VALFWRELMINLFFYFFIFGLGFALGAYFKNGIWERQPWVIYKWDPNVFGFRPVQLGSMLYKNDRVIMGLEINPNYFPDEGHKYTD
jgi:hypothetical protein